MPTYEYMCTKCGRKFELLQSITAPPKKRPDEPCAGCGERAPIRRLISGGGAVLFKGSGFYETDYRSESYKQAAKAEKDAGSKPADTDKAAANSTPAPAPAKPAEKVAKKGKGGGTAKGGAA